MRLGSRLLAWGALILYAVGTVASVFLRRPASDESRLETLLFTAAFGAFAVVGAMVAFRRPRNPVGLVFCTIGVLAGVGLLVWSYSTYSYTMAPQPLPGAVVATWIGNWLWYPLMGCIVILPILLFPSGLPSPRWRPVLAIGVALVLGLTILAAIPRTILVPTDSVAIRVDNPVGLIDVDSVEELGIFSALSLVLVAVALMALVSLTLRFRRSQGDERLQLKWFLYAVALLIASILAGVFVPVYNETFFGTFAVILGIAAIPVSCGLAIVKYRLYEIDRLINKTLVYVLVSVVLAGVYLASVVGLQFVLGPVAGDSDVAIAGSTLVAAALFRPARARFQTFIDRRFYRKRYDTFTTLQRFGARLRDEVDLEEVQRDTLTVVRETVQPSSLSLWLKERAT